MDKKDFHPIRNFFSFSRKELSGFYFLSFLIILFISLPFLFGMFLNDQQVSREKADQLDSLVSLMEKENQGVLFPFDPNTISFDSLALLGVPVQAARIWENYTRSGGIFKEPEDIRKIYGLDDSLADRIVPFVTIKETKSGDLNREEIQEDNASIERTREKDIVKRKDINVATSNDLTEVYGIGEVLSKRIIKYRNLLGGFVEMGQLHEVYGLDSAVVSSFKTSYFVEPSFMPEKVNVNTAEYAAVIRHPYLSKELTDKLFKVRNERDYVFTEQNFRQLVDNDSVCFKVLPYIEF